MREGQLTGSPIFIRIDRGISQFNHDYFAALGVPITVDVNLIRQRYLGIARILHPDVYGLSPQEKEIATQYLAKLVNPAYNVLMQGRDREAYQGIFKLLAKRLMQRVRNIEIKSEIAKQLLLNPNDETYGQLFLNIADCQYSSLDSILEYTAQLSELNLIYILYREGYRFSDPRSTGVLTYKAPQVPAHRSKSNEDDRAIVQTGDETLIQTTPLKLPAKQQLAASISQVQSAVQPHAEPQGSQPPTYNPFQAQIYDHTSDPANQDETLIQEREKLPLNPQLEASFATRIAMAEEYMSQKQWMQALKELRIATQLDDKDSECMALLGVVYHNINQPIMAKISFERALKLNSKEPLALQFMSRLNQGTAKQTDTPKGWFSGLLGIFSPNSKDRKKRS
ncbi:DnaJ domain-containing protein [Tumidithrix elongata RA019]|uniref:DnaJ domain-containing protein n=1 Tax=Tumidithrix elongata BACA0141 TaxID=2716417 RepID=A0AAW9PWN8_9CYAN|nr:DnaJ domain-containing protein [Tumidithrix elongata RA019]